MHILRATLFASTLIIGGQATAAEMSITQTIPDPILDPFFPIIGSFTLSGSGTAFTDSYTAAFDPFDTSLGTLLGARLSYNTGVFSFGFVTPVSGDPITWTAAIGTALTSAAFLDPGPIASNSDSDPGGPTDQEETFDLSAQLTGFIDATDLSLFTGATPVLVNLSNRYEFVTDGMFDGVAEQTAEFALTYLYDDAPLPAVPLPTGGALLLTGVFALTAARRRKT